MYSFYGRYDFILFSKNLNNKTTANNKPKRNTYKFFWVRITTTLLGILNLSSSISIIFIY